MFQHFGNKIRSFGAVDTLVQGQTLCMIIGIFIKVIADSPSYEL